MKSILTTGFIFCLLTVVISSKPLEQKELPEITKGNCTEAKDDQMVYHEIIEKEGIPLFSRNATVSWCGDKKIFCLKVLNEYNRKNGKGGGWALIKKGGVGHYYVTIEMHSEKGGEMKFLIFLYGN